MPCRLAAGINFAVLRSVTDHLSPGVEFNDHNTVQAAVGTTGIEVLNPSSPLFRCPAGAIHSALLA